MPDEFLVGTKETVPEELVVKANEEINNCPKYHSLEQHNGYAKRKMLCPYCNLKSKPVPKAKLEELNHVG